MKLNNITTGDIEQISEIIKDNWPSHRFFTEDWELQIIDILGKYSFNVLRDFVQNRQGQYEKIAIYAFMVSGTKLDAQVRKKYNRARQAGETTNDPRFVDYNPYNNPETLAKYGRFKTFRESLEAKRESLLEGIAGLDDFETMPAKNDADTDTGMEPDDIPF
jgi:hypothetical protein